MLSRLSLFTRFLFTYICILVFALIGGLLINYQYAKIIKSQTEQYNEVVLCQAQKVLDEKFAAMEKRLFDTTFNVSINSFLYTASSQSQYYYNMHLAAKELSVISLNAQNSQELLPTNIYLYHAKSGAVIDGTSKYDVEYYLDDILRYDGLSLQKWENMQLDNNLGTYFSSQRVSVRGVARNVITCINTLPLTPTRSKLGALGIMLDADHLTSILQDSLIDNVGAAFVLNEAGDVLLRAGSNRFEYFDPSVAADSDLYHDKETGEDIIITRIPSSVGGFSYVSAMPTSIYMGQINRMQTLTAVIIGVMLLFGLLLSMLFARKNTMPIKSLVYALQQNMLNREEQISSKNELDYIGQAVLSALAENRHVKQTMENYLPLLQSSLINQLLHGDPLHTERMLATLNASGVCMDKARFGVVVLSISAGREPDGSDDMNLAKFATSNLLREMLMQIGDVYTVNTGIEYIAVLIGSDLDNDRYMERLVDILYRASAFMQERMEVYPRFGLGSMQVAEGIHISFREARKACDFSFYNPQNNIVRYQDIKISAQIYSYPLETEMQLINSVKTGNSARMRELLRTIISENYTSLTLSLELARCLFFDIMSTAIKIMNEMSMDCQAAFDTDPVALLTSCTTIVEMEHALTSIFDTLCGIAGDKEISHNNQLKNTILEYIDKNFGNSDLCLNNIAGMLHLSPAYVSRFLKEYASINFMEYLRGKRIEKAVEYLGAGLSVNDVAAKVGYASSIVFIRNFKRLYGMTPGEMRTKLADPENQIQIYSGSK